MKAVYIITPPADKHYFPNKSNLPVGIPLSVNISALLYASKLHQQGKNIVVYDFWDKIPTINKTETEIVHLFLGYANYQNGLKIKKVLEKKNIKTTLNGIYNFIDGQNFSDISLLLERGIKCQKPVINMNTELNYTLFNSLDILFKLQNKVGQLKSLSIVSQYYGCSKIINCLHCSSDKISFRKKGVKLIKMPEQLIDEIIELKTKFNLEYIILGDLMNTDGRLKQLYRSYKTRKNKLPKLKIATAANYINNESTSVRLKSSSLHYLNLH